MTPTEYFVSGIDTDCGKTYITGLLAYHLKRKNYPFITAKLVQTGCAGISDDILEHRRLMESPLLEEDENGLTCAQIFSFPASPHLAAEIDDCPLDISLIRENTRCLLDKYPLVITEGAGGLMVPLHRRYLTADYIKKYALPLILVSSSKLGSINHTLLSVELCHQRGIDLRLVVYNEFPDAEPRIAADNFKVIQEYVLDRFPNALVLHSDDIHKEALASDLDYVFGDKKRVLEVKRLEL